MTLAGWRISLHSPHNLVLAIYALLLLRAVRVWRRHRRAILAWLDVRARPLITWHGWPVALWFLLPARLSCFLWYCSPAQTGEGPPQPLTQAARFYWNCWVSDYSPGFAVALLLLGLVGVTVWINRHLRPGGRVLVCFVVVAVALCLLHPNRKSRFLHTWMAGVWTSAGVGLVCLTHGRLTRRCLPLGRGWRRQRWLASVSPVCRHWRRLAPEGGPNPERLSCRDLADCYLPSLDDSRHATVLSNLPMKFLCRWTYLERHGTDRRLDTEIRDFTPSAPDVFTRWLATTPCDTVVFIDVDRPSCFYEYVPVCDRYEPLCELLATQTVFVQEQRGNCRNMAAPSRSGNGRANWRRRSISEWSFRLRPGVKCLVTSRQAASGKAGSLRFRIPMRRLRPAGTKALRLAYLGRRLPRLTCRCHASAAPALPAPPGRWPRGH